MKVSSRQIIIFDYAQEADRITIYRQTHIFERGKSSDFWPGQTKLN